MAVSRYFETIKVFDKEDNTHRFGLWPPIRAQELYSDDDVFIEIKEGKRIDALAKEFFSDGRYWWVICLMNDIHLPLGSSINPGTILRIPLSLNKIFSVIKFKQNEK